MWFVTYAYEVNTSIVYYVHIHMLRMRMRSIPRFLCKWYAFGVIYVRVQYLNCVLRLTLIFWCFVCVEAICLHYVYRLHHCWLFDVMIFLNICICGHVFTYLIVYMWPHMHILRNIVTSNSQHMMKSRHVIEACSLYAHETSRNKG